MVLSGLIRINGFLFKLTVDGRFRRHWKGQIRTIDSRRFNPDKVGVCADCGLVRRLTVDHIPPLREVAENHRKVLICKQCHRKKNLLEDSVVSMIAPNRINNCGLGHNTFLLDNLDIYCKVCSRVVNKLVCVGVDEFVTMDKVK